MTCRCTQEADGKWIIRGMCPLHVEPLMPSFDVYCDEWEAANPGETIEYGPLFAQFLANATGGPVIGRAASGDMAIAIPEDDEAHQ